MIAEFEVAAMTTLLVLFIVSAVAATVIAYVIGLWGRTSNTVTSSISGVITKDTACQAGEETTSRGQLMNDLSVTLCLALSYLC